MSVADSLRGSAAAFVLTRPYLSISHIRAAALFARQAGRMEKENIVGQVSEAALAEHRAYVLGSITLSVAFLEATINEVLTDVKHGVLGEWKSLDRETVRALKQELPRTQSKRRRKAGRGSGIIDKYDRINRQLNRVVFDPDGFLSNEIALLTRLRDVLVHPRPEWIPGAGLPDTPDGPPALRHELSAKFGLNPLFSAINPLFPDRCLSHGCARWAVDSCVAFVDDFFRGLRTDPIYGTLRAELTTE